MTFGYTYSLERFWYTKWLNTANALLHELIFFFYILPQYCNDVCDRFACGEIHGEFVPVLFQAFLLYCFGGPTVLFQMMAVHTDQHCCIIFSVCSALLMRKFKIAFKTTKLKRFGKHCAFRRTEALLLFFWYRSLSHGRNW